MAFGSSKVPHIKSVSNASSLYRGPIRKKRVLIGASPNIPVPIARINARVTQPVGLVRKMAPSVTKNFKQFNVGQEPVAGIS